MSIAKYSFRTHGCGELNAELLNTSVVLCGWVDSIRNHGGLIFVDLRDRSGIVQLVSDPETPSFEELSRVKPEWVIKVEGIVRRRPEGTENPKMPTGEVEVLVSSVEVLSSSKVPPFEIDENINVDERLRLKYRYLDLRRPNMMKNLIFRHEVALEVRKFLSANGFIEVETPYLTKSTPEGARDFLVPSRLYHGKFYALPQSPQLFKQILMVAGFEKYFQLARCFRDEDLRADRQPEHTQIDIEMSFVNEDDVLGLSEELIKRIFALASIELETPFMRITYDEAMSRFGSDKPDLRFDLEIIDLTDVFKDTQIGVFKVGNDGIIAGLNPKKVFSRSEIERLTEFVKEEGARGLAWFVKENGELRSPLLKFASEKEIYDLNSKILPDSTLFIMAGERETTLEILGKLRIELARILELIPENQFKVLWVTDFPMFEWSEEEKRYKAKHHPFTRPKEDTLVYLDSNPLKVKAYAYDLVINGVEVGGGSLRIFKPEIQKKIFDFLGIKEDEAQEKFGFLLEAFDYGVPPHGGIAFGLDRLIMIALGLNTIRDCIAFPKTQSGTCLLTGAPDTVSIRQLKELGIEIRD
ncbi:MAG: aspartate--tRNA ligase [Actinobacteria bacterium]|nr:aspartate--tRNA ligase [Actinomycetota bacterium]